MDDSIIKLNSVKAWFLAARPKTLTGAAVPVMIGIALAYCDNKENTLNYIPAILCFLFAFIMQIDANFVNDYFDFKRGNDDETRLGPKRACAQGWVTPRAMQIAITLTTIIACLVGLPLIYYGGWQMILIGICCVLFCILYTTSLSYIGLGDILVLIFFGIIPVCITYYLQTGIINTYSLIASIGCGFVIDTLLLINNYRDIDNDRRAKKRTLVVFLGIKGGQIAYFSSGLIAAILGMLTLWNCKNGTFFLPIIYIFFHYISYRKMVRIYKGRALNKILGETARNMFIYGILMVIGLLLNS